MTHTPTPWIAEGYYFSAKVPTGRPNGEVIGDTMPSVNRLFGMVPKEANTARLVAAVNFFHGRDIPTERLEQGGFWEMVNVIMELREAAAPEYDLGGLDAANALLAKLGVEP